MQEGGSRRNYIKRKISALMVGALLVTAVGALTHMQARDAKAKETLESITKVVAETTAQNPYTILEIVPDTVPATLPLTDIKGGSLSVSVNQSMGMTGYYVGGQEPVTRDLQAALSDRQKTDGSTEWILSTLNDTSLRRGYAQKLLETVIDPSNSIVNTVSDNATPLFFDGTGYREFREGEEGMTAEELAAGVSGGTWILLARDYDGTYAAGAKPYIDGAKGTMTPRANDGNFMGGYIPTYRSVSENEAVPADINSDYAVQFLGGVSGNSCSDGNFSYNEGVREGAFDPYLLYGTDTSGMTGAGGTIFRAQFERVSGMKTGYVAESSTQSVSGNAVGTPVYKDDGGAFVYAGEIKEISGNQIPCDDTGNRLPEDQDYYTVQFSYRDKPVTDGTALYQVSRFQTAAADQGGQYHLNTSSAASPLVPNTNMTGTVKALSTGTDSGGTTWQNFVYDYTPGYGNHTWNSFAENGLYQIRGSKIYYTTGLQNREWLKQYSFDRDAGEQSRSLPMTVTTKTASQVNVQDVNEAKMILLLSADGAAFCVNYGVKPGGGAAYCNYGSSGADGIVRDISPAVYKQIVARAVQENIPVAADYGIIRSGKGSTSDAEKVRESLMHRLICAMMVENLELYYRTIEHASDAEIKSDTTEPGTVSPTVSANNCHYVNKNVYVYQMEKATSGTTAFMKFVNAGFFSAVFSETAVGKGFSEVLIDIENENLYRQTDGNRPLLSTDMSQSTALRYIIGYAKKREYNIKGTMRVLELEPCASYDLSVDADNGILYKTKGNTKEELVNQKGTRIELTRMTTAEFIGRIEDLNAKYDMIYIGMNTGLINVDANGKTKYNDSSMNGLVYSSAGDYIYMQAYSAGLLDQDYIGNDRSKNLKGRSYTDIYQTVSRVRYSGNDITQEKEAALKGYVQAGYPLVLADDFLKVTQAANGITTKAVNADMVDNSSYLYRFVDAVKEKQNVFRIENLSPALFNWYINLAKPMLTMYGNSLAAQSNTVTIVRNPDDGQFYATYEFDITNNGAADSASAFDVKLYVDINADGKFSRSTEQITTLSVRNEDGTPALTTDGKYSLSAGKRYYANYVLSSEHAGILPWKLEVAQNNNAYRRSGAIGYYEVRQQEKTKIKILQINSSHNPTWNMQTEYEDTSSLFYKLLSDESVRYDVDIRTLSSTAFNEVSPTVAFEDYLEYLQEYDMLILGFGDCYREPNATAVGAIEEYIASGRSVLFTHDTTSFINAPSGQFYAQERDGQTSDLSSGVTYWGYQFNRMIRGLVGMDRYNVLGAPDGASDRTYERETVFAPNSARGRTLGEVQGFTYPAMNRFAYTENDGNGRTFPTFRNLSGIDTGDGQYSNEYVTQVNSGQITTYPYKLQERFNVAPTHAQYYQLDFTADDDKDGESDIVVWYCISDSTDKPVTGTSERDMYEMSPNDVRNNYYIYNKGNITYSGVGHSSVMSNGSEQEIKLFINTMIAAYRAGLHAPVVDIRESYQDNARSVQNIYVSYDTQLKNIERNAVTESGVMDLTEDIYFKASAVSLIQNTVNTEHQMSAKLYLEVPEGTPNAEIIYLDKDPVTVLPLPMTGSSPYYDDALYYRDETSGAEIKANPEELVSGQTYRTKVPVYLLGANGALWNETAATTAALNTRRVFIVATDSVYNRKTGRLTALAGSDTASLVRIQVFDLD